MLIAHVTDLDAALDSVHDAAREFSLTINEAKSAIMCVREHDGLRRNLAGAVIATATAATMQQCNSLTSSYRGFPVVRQYKYLGALVNSAGELHGAISAARNRAAYLTHVTHAFVPRLRFENQYLLWCAYVRPYLQYVAAAVAGTQTRSVQEAFHRAWRVTLKRFLGLPDSFPEDLFERVFDGRVGGGGGGAALDSNGGDAYNSSY